MFFFFSLVKKNKQKGVVVSLRDTVAVVEGLQFVTSGELVSDLSGNLGVVLNLEMDRTGVIMFSEDKVTSGDLLIRLYTTLSTRINPFNLGNVFDSLGTCLTFFRFLDRVSFNSLIEEYGYLIRDVELKAPGIIVRQPVYESLLTGLMGVDGLLPLGQGQRELIIGDRQTGKTAIAVDTILNQSNQDLLLFSYTLR